MAILPKGHMTWGMCSDHPKSQDSE